MKKSDFNGAIQYNQNGDVMPGSGVRVFASGLRNPYDLVLHSNGRLYGTDNGPNNVSVSLTWSACKLNLVLTRTSLTVL